MLCSKFDNVWKCWLQNKLHCRHQLAAYAEGDEQFYGYTDCVGEPQDLVRFDEDEDEVAASDKRNGASVD